MSIVSLSLALVVAFVSYSVYRSFVNVHPSVVKKADKRYDYIIVGGGTTGCVLAARLSEDPRVKVLLIEAGEQMGFFTQIPLTPTAAQQGTHDWSVHTVPQRYSSFGLWGQTHIIPRGKGLGGSGQINFLLHGFGLPEDYERWTSAGFRGWSLRDLQPYFRKAFGTTEAEYDSQDCAGDECNGSPMKLKKIEHRNELMNVFREASRVTSGSNVMFRKPTATLLHGRRHSTFNAYLEPALKRKNLHVLLKTRAVSIRFENNIATSLYILQNHVTLDNIFVNKEIIVCAGAVNTPQLLMLSGIGPADVLKRLKIRPLVVNEAVGRNFHDQMNLPLYVSIREPISVTLSKVFTVDTLWQYMWHGKGLLSFPPVSGVEYQNSSALMLFSMGTASEKLLRDLSNYRPQVFRDTFPFHNSSVKEGFMFLASCLQPRSRGRVSLVSTSTAIPPAVDPNYLRSAYDVRCTIEALRRAEKLVASAPFKAIGARIHWPRSERCQSLWRYSRRDQLHGGTRKKGRNKRSSPPSEYLECLLREVAVTGHHAGGTCAGGTVVDDQLRLKSVKRVRVVDASILPSPVSLFPNSVLVGIAEKAADLIRKNNE